MYAWIITRDYRDGSQTSTRGPYGHLPQYRRKLERGEGRPFRLRNEDGALLYEGRLLGPKDRATDLAPLDDFGHERGAVVCEIVGDNGLWESV